MDCNKIIFRFCFGYGCRLTTSLSEILAQQEHILGLANGPLPKPNLESDQNTALLTQLHAPGFGGDGSETTK